MPAFYRQGGWPVKVWTESGINIKIRKNIRRRQKVKRRQTGAEYVVRLYNTLKRTVETFTPLEEGKVGLYCCGPTVYNFAHIGNLRTYIFEDLLRRVLEAAGYRVNHVMNITDVGHLSSNGDEGEDKMLRSAREKGMDVWDIARFFTEAFFKDMRALHNKEPSVVAFATQHIDDMIDIIKKIEAAGYAYQAGGNLYFDTGRDESYGLLRGYGINEESVSRVGIDANKRHHEDFVLWFTDSKFERQAMVWESPWGRGYPGWHIECSAMSHRYLGRQFDIHCGGVDHIGTHHTNEIAQGMAAYSCVSARYWLHSEFLMFKGGKMSKSEGSFLTLDKLREMGFDAFDYRYFCLSSHYRKKLVFSEEAMAAARTARSKLMARSIELKNFLPAEEPAGARALFDDFKVKLFNDLNSPEALAAMWTMLKNKELPAAVKAWTLKEINAMLDIGLFDEAPEATLESSLMQLINERAAAKKAGDFAKADEMRAKLLEAGISIKDTPEGTVWQKIKRK
jgi:cysteinyl-tRNA synthetase